MIILNSIPRWNPDWKKCPQEECQCPAPVRRSRGFQDLVEQKMGQIQTLFLELSSILYQSGVGCPDSLSGLHSSALKSTKIYAICSKKIIVNGDE